MASFRKVRSRFGTATGIAVVVAILSFIALLHYSAYISEWSRTSELPDVDRRDLLARALKRGDVSALRETGGGTTLKAAEIVQNGNSRCTWDYTCERTRSSRRGANSCSSVRVDYFCGYEVLDGQGHAAMVLLKVHKNNLYSPPISRGDEDHWLHMPLIVERPSAGEFEGKLCELGFCTSADLQRFKGALTEIVKAREAKLAREAAEAAETERRRLARCAGIFTGVVGRGETCLDPSVPTAREFRDCKGSFCGPVMVALPKGRYLNGTSEEEAKQLQLESKLGPFAFKAENPKRDVTIGYHVAVAKFEVTFEDWDACVSEGGCSGVRKPSDNGGGRGKLPVSAVSWDDIRKDFLPWLNRKLGMSSGSRTAYRLLTDGEWEFAARAGTTTRYAFGDMLTKAQAQIAEGPDGRLTGAAVVGSFPPNAFGLHDMHGNVSEWVEDCGSFFDDYKDAPNDGSARKEGGCSYRIVRGGGWTGDRWQARSAVRGRFDPTLQDRALGLRVARTLPEVPLPGR